MRIYYFVHLTGRDIENSGTPSVVLTLGRALQALSGVELVPVRWSREDQAVVHVEQVFLDTLAAHVGPIFNAATRPGQPIRTAEMADDAEDDWLLIAEVPHLQNHDPHCPSVPIIDPLTYARRHWLRSAVVLHHILPLTYPQANGGDEAERLKFTVYAQALVTADVILPVSRSTGAELGEWFSNAGYRPELWPRIVPRELPEQIAGQPRHIPDLENPAPEKRDIEFLTFGTVCARKNQLVVLEAFNRVLRRRPELALTLHVAGHCEAELVSKLARLIGRSGGRIQSHGYIVDSELVNLITAARATIFVSLAEGYGLPVAESLWLGTPCLCSNIAPIAEIAEGGGCLTVDPTDVGAISAAIEQLATDDTLYRRLLSELAERNFRTWADYASAVVGELATAGEAERTGTPRRRLAIATALPSPPKPKTTAPVSPCPAAVAASRGGEHDFTIAAGDLRCHGAYIVNGVDLLRNGDHIGFAADRSRGVDEPVLFFGPYISVEPGVDLLDFDGELDGTLKLRFTHQQGQRIKDVPVDSFAPLVCLALTRAYDEFEVVGERTDALKSFTLRSIRVRHIKP
jgi:glycosyltransferase involved in cell wall biosynthesis